MKAACSQTHWTHIGHLFCCYCKQIQAWIHFFSITHTPKYAFLVTLFLDHMQNINIPCHFYTQVHTWEGGEECCEGRQCFVGAAWCASAGFHLSVLWLLLPSLIENIPWNFLTLPRPRHSHFADVHTHTCPCVCSQHKII